MRSMALRLRQTCGCCWESDVSDKTIPEPKWCAYCQKDTHSSRECWATHTVPYVPATPEQHALEAFLSACMDNKYSGENMRMAMEKLLQIGRNEAEWFVCLCAERHRSDRLLTTIRKLVNEPQDITSKAYQQALAVLREFEETQ